MYHTSKAVVSIFCCLCNWINFCYTVKSNNFLLCSLLTSTELPIGVNANGLAWFSSLWKYFSVSSVITSEKHTSRQGRLFWKRCRIIVLIFFKHPHDRVSYRQIGFKRRILFSVSLDLIDFLSTPQHFTEFNIQFFPFRHYIGVFTLIFGLSKCLGRTPK